MTTPNGSPELAVGQASKEATVNEMVRRTERGAGFYPVVDKDLTAPPGSCADGATYIVAGAPTGAWSGHAGDLAVAAGTNASNGWYFRTPEEGLRAYVQDENAEYAHDGAAWVAYSAAAAGALLTAGGTMTGDLTLAGDPTNALHAAPKQYVDAKVAGLSWKQAARAATTVAGTLATSFENGDTVDGVVLATGDRILIKNQAAPAENGIYVVAASGAPARASDADAGAELVNATVYVSEGTANADTQWTCTTNAPITAGVTSLAFAQISTAGTVFASAAEYRAGTEPAKALAPDQLWASAADVALTPGTNVALDLATGFNFTLAMGGNYTLDNPTNTKPQSGVIEIVQDGTGSRTLAYGTSWEFAGGTAPVLSTAAGAKDLLFYQVRGPTSVFANLVKAVA